MGQNLDRVWTGHSCTPITGKRHFQGSVITYPAVILNDHNGALEPQGTVPKGKKSQAPLRAYTCLEIHRNFKFMSNSSPTSCIMLLQTPRMAEVRREFWSFSCAIPLLKLFLKILAKIVQPDFQNGFYKNVQVPQVVLPLTPVEVSSTGGKYVHRNLSKEHM